MKNNFYTIVMLLSLGSSIALHAETMEIYAVGYLGPDDGLQNELHRFDENGNQLQRWAIPDSRFALSMTMANGILYVAEFDGAINRYGLDGEFLGALADVSGLASTDKFIGLQSVESDMAGNIYSTFGGNSSKPRTSFRIAADGEISASFSHPALVFPVGIDAASSGDVFILNSAAVGVGNRLFRFDPGGTLLDDFAIPEVDNANDIAINEATNELFVSDGSGDAIHIYDIATGAPVFNSSIATPDSPQDVFVELTTGRIFGTSIDSEVDEIGFFYRSEGFEVTRGGTLLNIYTEDAIPRQQSVFSIVAISVPEPDGAGLLALMFTMVLLDTRLVRRTITMK